MENTTKNLVVLGAGTAGTMVANKLRKRLPDSEWTITVVAKDDIHDYQPGYLFIPFGMNTPQQIRRSSRQFLSPDLTVVMAEVERVDRVDAAEARLQVVLDGAHSPTLVTRRAGACSRGRGRAGNRSRFHSRRA